MKKKVLAVMLAAAVGLIGCGNSGTAATSGTAADNSGTENNGAAAGDTAGEAAEVTSNEVTMDTIRVWSDNAHEKELRVAQIEEFNNTVGKELGITIEYTVYGTNWENTIKIAAQSDEAPDLFRPNGTFLEDFVNAGYIVPISDLPGTEEFLSQYEGQLVTNQHIFHDQVYTLPYNLTTYKFVINRDLFDKNGLTDAPETWAQVREYARIITDNGGGTEYGFALGLQSSWLVTSYITRPAGQDMGNIGFDNDTLQFNFKAVAPKLDAIAGMVADGSVLPGASGMDADVMRAQFAEGRVGMLPAVSFDVGVYNDQFPAKCNWEVVSIPTFAEGPAPYKEFCDATSLLAVGKAAVETPERAAKVARVLEFFYADENAAAMYEDSLYIPYRQEAIDMAAKEPEAKGFADFANVPDKVLMLPMPDRAVTVEGNNMEATIITVISENPDTDPITALTEIDNKYNAALAEQMDPERLETYRTPEGRDVKAQ